MLDERTLERLTRNEADMAFKRRVRTIFEWIAPADGMRVYDCGCGRGFYLHMIRAVAEARLFGLELDPDVVFKARRNVVASGEARVVRADIYHQPWPDTAFDAAIISEVLEHLDDDVRALR